MGTADNAVKAATAMVPLAAMAEEAAAVTAAVLAVTMTIRMAAVTAVVITVTATEAAATSATIAGLTGRTIAQNNSCVTLLPC